MPSKGFVEEGKRTARGESPSHIAWNSLNLGGSAFSVERPSTAGQAKRINLEDIPYTLA